MDVALVTCAEYPELDPFDRPLLASLRAIGLEAGPVIWDDPTVDWAQLKIAVIRSAWDSHLRPSQFLAWAERAGRLTRLHNPAEVIAWNLHKSYLRGFSERGIPVTPTEWVAERGTLDVARLLRERGWKRIVVKPAVSAGARETHVFGAGEEVRAQQELERLTGSLGEVMIQPYLQSFETLGERSYVYVDGALSHVVRRPASLKDVQSAFEQSFVLSSVDPNERAIAEHVMDHVGRGLLYARVDLGH